MYCIQHVVWLGSPATLVYCIRDVFWLGPPAPNHRRTCFGWDPRQHSYCGQNTSRIQMRRHFDVLMYTILYNGVGQLANLVCPASGRTCDPKHTWPWHGGQPTRVDWNHDPITLGVGGIGLAVTPFVYWICDLLFTLHRTVLVLGGKRISDQ